jgi:hypothetical protein
VSASKPCFTTSYAMLRMRPGEKRTQKIELPRVTLNLILTHMIVLQGWAFPRASDRLQITCNDHSH